MGVCLLEQLNSHVDGELETEIVAGHTFGGVASVFMIRVIFSNFENLFLPFDCCLV